MNRLGLDIASVTGYAFGRDGKVSRWGTWEIPGLSDAQLPRSLGSLYSAIVSLIRSEGIGEVAIEAAMRGIKRENKRGFASPVSSHGERGLTMLNGVAIAAVSNSGAKLVGLPAPATWRKVVLGHGFPENPKSEALRYCALMGWNVEEHDAAEAVCILQWAHGQRFRKAA